MPEPAPPSTRTLVVGLDGGGSTTRALCVDDRGALVGRGQAAGSNPNNSSYSQAAKAVLDALRHAKADPQRCRSLCLGIAGLADPERVEAFRRALLDAAPALADATLHLTHDLEIAHYAAFAGQPGILLIAGTGSAAYAIAPDGSILRQSGRTDGRDDPGSGYSIGKNAIERQLAAPPDPPSRDRIARLARTVFEDAAFGGLKPLELLREEANALLELACPLLEAFAAAPHVPIALHGGLLQADSLYREILLGELRERHPQATLVEPNHSPTHSALQLAWRATSSIPLNLPSQTSSYS